MKIKVKNNKSCVSMRYFSYFIMPLSILFLLSISDLSYAELDVSRRGFMISTEKTRVIYPLSSVRGESLVVTNPQDYPILVQTQIKGENKHSIVPFIVTPPLFRLDSGARGQVRIIRTGGDFPQDRESLLWVCLTGVPPKEGDIWNSERHPKNGGGNNDVDININIAISTCIKLFIRPDKIAGDSEAVTDSLDWKYKDKELQVNNPTPFYINFSFIRVGDKYINISGENGCLAPFSSRSFALPVDIKGAPSEISWRIINDLGAESKIFKASL